MATTKTLLGVIGATAILATGAVIYLTIQTMQSRKVLAESAQRQDGLHAKQRELESRIAAEARRARAVEEENAGLRKTIQSAQTAKGTARELFNSRLKHADELLRGGQFDSALSELLWCNDEGMSDVGGYHPVVPSLLGQLAKKHPPALVALRERRDKAEQRLLGGTYEPYGAMAVSALNNALGESSRNLVLFDQLPADDQRRAMLLGPIFDQLVEARRYSDVVAARPYDQMLAQFARSTQARPIPANVPDAERARQMLREFVVKSTAQNIEVLTGAGDLDHAQALAGKLLGYDSSDQTKALVQKHAERAGHPELLAALPK